ncbi:hypothetical protein [Pseudomonas brassicacearum]|uniref:hypothetical protein n=1 Tax=Pseudomonas brassicacearum TaxID=930166 RepID=UPI0011F3ACCF|nr:hypothetical protein [Pseudomonas brassicacearum]QEO79870.1 hypothetical protein ELZ14_20780 [Pseudomonas brassicacearum]
MSNPVFEASDEVVNEAAASCARRLTKWFGGLDEAIAALEADPTDLADIALRDHVKERRQMTVKAHMNIQVFSREVLEKVA